ncbi:MAG: hypothetical protein QNL24_04815 [Akkermansiaceae bacterium]
MKAILISLTLILQVCAVEPPQTHIVSRYNHLGQTTPISDPPPPPEEGGVKNDIDDWVLVGLEEYVGGKVVTLVNKKNTKERVRVPSNEELAKDFAVLEVKKSDGSYLESEVHIQKGPHRGWVKFDSKYLVLRKAPVVNSNKKKTNTPAQKTAGKGAPPGLPAGATKTVPAKETKKPPRTRYIPKPK